MSTARDYVASSVQGTQTSTIAFGGNTSPGGATPSAVAEEFDGSSWTEVGDLNTARNDLIGVGTSTSSIVYGGTTGSVSALAEQWDGSAWTEVGDLNTARNALAGSGTSTSALAFIGNPYPSTGNLTEFWDGSSWTEVADLATKRLASTGSPAGTSSLALASGGETTTSVANTEEFTADDFLIKTVTTS